jgi:hypothetical protein
MTTPQSAPDVGEESEVTETKNFPTEVLLSLASGITLCGFSEIHEAAEFVLGHPIWTHEFAIRATFDTLRELILEQHPQLASANIQTFPVERLNAVVSELHEQFGSELEVSKGGEARTANPIETLLELRPDMKIIPLIFGEAPNEL